MDSSSTEAVPVMQVKCVGFSFTVFYCPCRYCYLFIDIFWESVAGRNERERSGEGEQGFCVLFYPAACLSSIKKKIQRDHLS